MSFLLRSVASSSRRLPSLIASTSRYYSTTVPENPALPGSTKSTPDEPAQTMLRNPMRSRNPNETANIDWSSVRIPDPDILRPPHEDEDSWWRSLVHDRAGHPGNQFSGRQELKGSMSASGQRYYDFNMAYRKLGRRLRESNVRRELQLGEYFEKPGEKKRRLVSERHRRRFQEMVRRKVQLVQTIRNRA